MSYMWEDIKEYTDGRTYTLIDDDAFTTATSTNIASAESIKAYVDGLTGTNIVSTGALNVGSITSGFGEINIETSALTTGSITLTSGATCTTILDEDTFASDSNTALATQQSIKAYVDGLLYTLIDDDTFATATSTNIASAESIKAYVDGLTGTNIVSTGALNVGSITSGFGSINIGTSTLTSGDIASSGEIDQTVAGTYSTAHNTSYTFVNDSTSNSSGDTITLFTLSSPFGNHTGLMTMDLTTTTSRGTTQTGRYTFAIGRAQGSTWHLKTVVNEGATVYSDANTGDTQSVVVSVVNNNELWTGVQTSSIRVANTISSGFWYAQALVNISQIDSSATGLMTLA